MYCKLLEYQSNNCYNHLIYPYWDKYKIDEIEEIITLHWKPENKQTCLSITYLHSTSSFLQIIIDVFDENRILLSSTELKKSVSSVLFNVLNYILKNNWFTNN